MSRKLTDEMIARAKSDADFCAALQTDPDAVFAKTTLFKYQQNEVLAAISALGGAATKRAPKAAKANAGDNLTKIEGIGKKTAEVLTNAGISTYAALAESTAEQIKAILKAAGGRYNMMVPDTWPEQAVLANAGDWAGLKALQDELDGGKRK